MHVRNVAGHQRDDQIERPEREQASAGRAEHAQHEVLGQGLADDPAARGAERQADRELLAASEHALELQVGDVGARNEQHEPDRAEQGVKRRAQLVERLLVERDERQLGSDLSLPARDPLDPG